MISGAVTAALKRLEAENREMRSDLRDLKSMLRALIATDNEMRGVRAWRLEKLKHRNRKSEERARKKETDVVSKPLNKEAHCLTRNLYDILQTRPRIWNTMMGFMERMVGGGNPTAWFVYMAAECPRSALTFLVCLYNNTFRQKWIKNTVTPFKVFRGWTMGSGEKAPEWTEIKTADMFPPTVPGGVWQLERRERYANAYMWKVYAVVYNFLEEHILSSEEFEKAKGDLHRFTKVVRVMSEMSGFEVLPEKEWAPASVHDPECWSEPDAKRACRLVVPEVTLLKEMFKAGLRVPITSYFE